MSLSLLSRDDVFISYSRQDGSLYAAGLADKLTEKGLTCFIDKLGTEPNHDLPDSLRKKIKSCTVFVLVGTPKASVSKFVGKEIAEFRKTGRTILPVDFEGSVGNADWYRLIPGIAVEPERDPEALRTGDPSANVVNFVEKSFKYTRRNQLMFRMFVGALTIFLTLSAVSIVAFFVARNQVAKASTATRLAAEKTEEAKTAATLADLKTGEANRAAKLAEEKTGEAAAAAALAQEKAHAAAVAQAAADKAEARRRIAEINARKQESVATSREGAATALSLLPFDPQESVKRAAGAYHSAPTTQAADALRKALFESHIQSVLRGHSGIVWDAIFGKDGQLALTSSRDGSVRVWDPLTGREAAKLSGAGDLIQVRMSPDGKYVAAAASEEPRTMFLWKIADEVSASTPKPRVLQGVVGPGTSATQCSNMCAIRAVAFSPDSRHVAAAGDDGVIWVWETDTAAGELGRSLDAPNNAVNQLTFSPDGEYILSAGSDGQALLWKWQAERSAANPRALKHDGPVETARFSPDGRYILTAWNKPVQGETFARTEGGEAWVWRTGGLEPPVRLAGHTGALVSAEFSADGQYVVTASDDATARVWHWNSAAKDSPVILRGHTAGLHSAEFSPDGRYVVTSSQDGTARVWKPETNRYVAELNKKSAEVTAIAVLRGHSGDLWRATYSPDGQYILTASEDQTARVWKAQVENVAATLPPQRLSVQGAAFSPNRRYIVTTTAGYQPVRIWDWNDTSTRGPVAELRLPRGAAFRVPVFSPDGKFVAAVLDKTDGGPRELENTVAIWEWGREECRRSPILLTGHHNRINSVAFSHDAAGRYVMTASGATIFGPDGKPLFPTDNTVRIYDRSSETGLRNPIVLAGHTSEVGNAVFSSDDRYIVSASSDGVRVWDWRTDAGRRSPVVLHGVTSYGFSRVAISPDGEYIAAAGGGLNLAAVWKWRDAKARNNPVVLRGHTDYVTSIDFSPKSGIILTSSHDGTERLWDARTGLMLSILSGHERASQTASFSSDGRLIVVTDNLMVSVYSCDACAAPDDLMTLVTEQLTHQGPGRAADRYIP
jgi:WD40 repeat protein